MGITEGDVDIVNGRLHYYRAGGLGKPSIVLTHGFTDNGLCFIQVAKALADSWDLIMPDMRGHGLSSRVVPGDEIDMPADLGYLKAALRLERPVLCGHSMGAMVSFLASIRFPYLVRALILEDPPWWPQPWAETSPEVMGNPFIQWARSLPSISLESLLADYRRDHPQWPDDLIQAMCQSKKQLDPSIGEIMTRKMNCREGHWSTTLPSLECPCLVLSADPTLGGIVSPTVEATIRELNHRVQVLRIPGAGHLIRFDAFDGYIAALRSFLGSL